MRVRQGTRARFPDTFSGSPANWCCGTWNAAGSDVPLESEADEVAPRELSVIDDPLAGLTQDEAIGALRRAVQALPRRYREVVMLCDLEEMDYAEAAVVLGCPIGTVRSRLHRARALLLEKLNQDRKPRPAVDAWKPMRYAI